MTVLPNSVVRARERLEDLSPMPWGWNSDGELCSLADGQVIPIRPHNEDGTENADGKWIPKARKDIVVLLAYIDQLHEELVRLGGQLEKPPDVLHQPLDRRSEVIAQLQEESHV